MSDESDEQPPQEPSTDKVLFLKDSLQHGRDGASGAQFVARRLQESKNDGPEE